MMLLVSLLLSWYTIAYSNNHECEKATKNYYEEKSFSICRNFMAGHDLYFTPNCPINSPRNCIVPTPSDYIPFEKQQIKSNASIPPRSFYSANDKRITFSNMTAVRERFHKITSISSTGYAISMDCLKCWEYEKQQDLWSKYVDKIERVAGISFSDGGIRTVLEFGCGTGGSNSSLSFNSKYCLLVRAIIALASSKDP
jgi:hypothetical protein